MLAAAAHALRRELQRLGCKKLARVQQGQTLKAAVTPSIRPCEEHTSGGTPAQTSGVHAAPHTDTHSRGRRPQEHAIHSVGLASFLQQHDLCPEGSHLSAFLGQAPPRQQQEWQQEFGSNFSPLAAKELLAPALAEYFAGEQHKRQLNLAANGFPWEEGSEQNLLRRTREPAQPAESERSAMSQTGAAQEEPTSSQVYQQEQGAQMAPAPADGTAVQPQAACTSAQGQADGAEPLEQAEAEGMQAATKRTYQPSTIVRKRRHGFLSRVRTRGGRKVIKRRIMRGRNIITA